MARALRIGTWVTFGSLMVVMGIVWAQAQWQGSVDMTLVEHSGRISISEEKYAELEARASELQAVYYSHQDRIELLEARVDTLYARSSIITEVTLDLYEAVTGEEWAR